MDTGRQTNRFDLEALENRILLSGDGLNTVAGPHPQLDSLASAFAAPVIQETAPIQQAHATLAYDAAARINDCFGGMSSESLGVAATAVLPTENLSTTESTKTTESVIALWSPCLGGKYQQIVILHSTQ